MKKTFNSLMVLAAVATTFFSCSKEVDTKVDETPAGEMKTVTVKTDIETRTTLDANHENIVWSAGDKISIFNDQNNTMEMKEYESGADLIVSVPAATEEIYAYYPHWNNNTNGPKQVSININKNQTQEKAGELNGYYFPMVAKGTVREETVDNETVYKAIISLYPVASALALNIYNTNLSGEEKVNSVTVIPSGDNTKFTGSQKTDITVDNVVYTTGAVSDPITVTLTTPYALGSVKPTNKQTFEGQIYVCLAKQSYANVTFNIETTKGTYTIKSNNTPFNCIDNDFVPVNIDLAKAETPYVFTETTFEKYSGDLTEGDYIVFYDNYAMKASVNNNRWGYSAVTPSGTSITTDDGEIVWHISKDGDYWTLYNKTNKVFAVGNGTKNQGALKASVSGTEAQFTVTGTNPYEFVNKKNSDAGVNCNLRNNGTSGFALYSTQTGGALTLYKVDSRVLSSIALSGTYPTEFYVGDTFSYDGLIVTATFEDASTATVSPTSVSAPDMTSAGTKEVTVSYTFNGVTKTANYNVTVSARPAFTVTLGDDNTTLTEASANAGVTLPSRSDVGDYSFVGWCETNLTTATETAPTIISVGLYNPTSNITLYPVYSSTTTSTGWVKTELNAVTAGTYIIYNQFGYPFDGTISSGHGNCIETAITFDGDVATSIPTGALEITFTAVTDGFTMYNADNGYLYATKAGSGGLAWHKTESSYWLYKSSNWTYNSNSAFLRSYNSAEKGIRTYGNNSGNGTIQLIKKATVSNTTYTSNPS